MSDCMSAYCGLGGEKCSSCKKDERIEELEAKLADLMDVLAKLAAKQAKIDMLLLEYCPEEMTAKQKRVWAENQVPDNEFGDLDLEAQVERLRAAFMPHIEAKLNAKQVKIEELEAKLAEAENRPPKSSREYYQRWMQAADQITELEAQIKRVKKYAERMKADPVAQGVLAAIKGE